MAALRPLTFGDLPQIARLEAELYEPPLRISEVAFRQLLALFPQGALGMFDEGRLCAFVFAVPLPSGTVLELQEPLARLPDDADVLYIHNLGVAATHRGRGLAAELIAAAFEVARSCGLGASELVSVHGSEPFWSRYGFVPVSTFEYVPGAAATQMRAAIPGVGPMQGAPRLRRWREQ